MKATTLVRVTAVLLALLTVGVGCKKRPDRVTTIPNLKSGGVGNEKMAGPAVPLNPNPGADGVIPLGTELTGFVPSAEQPFAADTVYFDFDKAIVKASEVGKIERVANAMKNYPGKALRIEGHCDERGTEEYNRALGENRALAVRAKLVSSGMDSGRVDTISYGEDRPAETGHDQGAWAKNRRAAFILIEPPSSASAQ